MESKNIKPRIVASLRAIGEPATAREIADIGMIEEPIHARLREMVEHGHIIGTKNLGRPMLYALPEWQHQDSQAAEEPDMAETPPVDSPAEKLKPAEPVLASGHDEEPFSDLAIIRNAMKEEMREVDRIMIDYISCLLKEDPVYQSLVSSKNQLYRAICEMGQRGII